MAKKGYKSQKKKKISKTKKITLKSSNVKVKKKDNLVTTVKKGSVSTIKRNTNNDKKDTYKKQNIDKKKNLKDLDLPKLKEEKPKVEAVEKQVEKPVEEVILPKKIKEEVNKEKQEEFVDASYIEEVKEEKKETKEDKEDKALKNKEDKKRLVDNNQVLYNIFVSDYLKQNKKLGRKKRKQIYDYEEENDFEEEVKRVKSDKWYVNLFYFIKDNLYLLFNTVLGVIFVFLMIALVEIKVISSGFILYVGGLLLFLIIVAMSYNKYISGRILTILLCLGMSFALYKFQYNYDFLDSLDHNNYEAKTYYVVVFDNNLIRKIYSLNEKKVGILGNNMTNVKRKLNTKVESINYNEYNNLQDMATSFFKSEIRAVIVTPNQYNYLVNSEGNYNKKVKILYTFDAIGLK